MPIFRSSCISHVSPMNNQRWLQWFAFAAFTCISFVGYSSLGHEVYVPTLDWHLCSPEGCLAISVLVIAYLNAPLVSPVVTLFTWQNCSPGFHQLFMRHHNCRFVCLSSWLSANMMSLQPSCHVQNIAHLLPMSWFRATARIPRTYHQSLVPATLHLDVQSSCTSAAHTWQRCRIDLSHWSHPEISIKIRLLAILSTTIWHPAISRVYIASNTPVGKRDALPWLMLSSQHIFHWIANSPLKPIHIWLGLYGKIMIPVPFIGTYHPCTIDPPESNSLDCTHSTSISGHQLLAYGIQP